LPDGFLDKVSSAAKKKNSEVMLLGEVWEDASNKIAYSYRRRYLQGGQFDSITNYPFKEDILHFVKTGDAARLANTIKYIVNNYPKHTLDNLMNLLGTHDTARILTVLGDNGKVDTREERANAKLVDRESALAKLKMAAALQFTLPGIPSIYYGDEVGMEGFEDPFNRRCYPWDNPDKKVLGFYRKLGKIRSLNKHIYANGEYKLITAENNIFAFSRTGKKESMVTIVNNSDSDYEISAKTEYVDLLTNKPFKGQVKAGTAVVLKETMYIPPKSVKV